MPVTAFGFIAFKGNLFHGIGMTAEMAMIDAVASFDQAGVEIPESDLDTMPATSLLMVSPGDSGWRVVDGVACTRDEAEATDEDEDEVPEPVAAGFAVVQERLAIFGVGKTEVEAKADAAEWVDRTRHPDERFDGLDVIPCSQALIDEVRANGAPSTWNTVDGVACTDAQADAWGD